MTQRVPSVLSFLLLSGSAFAQATSHANAADIGARLSSWRISHGSEWRIALDDETGYAQMVFGGHTAAQPVPRTDEGYFELARTALAESIGLHGIETSTLENGTTTFLPLGIVGSNDKMTVRLRQVVGGVPVEEGFVNVLFDMQGRVLSIQTTALPQLSSFDVQPALSSDDAAAAAVAAFRERTGVVETSVATPVLVVDQDHQGVTRTPRLAWKVDVKATSNVAQPQGFAWFVDAKSGVVYRDVATIHNFDVSGTVTSNATPGLSSDNPANPPVQQPMRFMSVTSGAVTVQTDTNGDFTLPGLTAPVQATVGYAGPRCVVLDDSNPVYTLTTTLNNPTGNTIQMAPVPTEDTTAQANIYRCALVCRDYIQNINPADTHANFLVIGHAMVPSSCNAYYDGSAINFYESGNGCSNFAFSTIVNHELGHWMNDQYGTGNGSDGMGEGNADVWEMYIWDNPVGGQGAFNGSGFIRTGLNTRQFCGDGDPQCWGEVHDGGEVWMGAAWKIRDRLNVALGNTMGDLTANQLFLDWMTSYNQTQIRSIIETQWLTLDDDNGNLNDLTPHYAQIDPAFRAQGFPGFVEVTIGNVTSLPDTTNTLTPYTVNAHIVPVQNGPLSATQLKYRINGGGFLTVNMTSLGNDDYSASIPAHSAPAHIEWYVTASSSSGSTTKFPAVAPSVPLSFDVGIKHVLRSHDFEAATAEGWTHGLVAGTDEWQRGDPAGKFGNLWSDPASGFSGTNCWGTDLGMGTANGTYASNSNTWLRSPVTDCTGAVGTHLRFKRWLSIQGPSGGLPTDVCHILVNGAQVYVNPLATVDDGKWVAVDIDISAQADNNPAVTLEWNLVANNGTNRGGWNIDDVEMVWVEAPPPCPAPVNYCIGAPNTAGPGAVMNGTGTQYITLNNFGVEVTGCPPFTNGLFYYGPNAIQAPFGNGFRCVGGAVRRLHAQSTDFIGDAVHAIDVNDAMQPIHAGETWRFQFWYRNPAAGGAGFNLSDGLAVQFCP